MHILIRTRTGCTNRKRSTGSTCDGHGSDHACRWRRILSFFLYAAPNNIGERGLEVKIFLDEQLLNTVHFVEAGYKGVSYHVPRMTGEDISLKMEVNRTFNPHSQGISTDVKKNREQGVAIGPVTFLRIMPPGVKHVTMRD